ncbi:MAG TPA: YceI family protein [Rhodanobacteraceae bacterium]|jgi:polyisoprenoid-binding protein YceI|nr:YceI family protein [Rhodanobacteraceae bacterium]
MPRWIPVPPKFTISGGRDGQVASMARLGLKPVFLLIALAFVAHVARADDSTMDHVALDSERSHAEFGVKVMWLLTVHGHFGKVSGDVDVDRFRNFASVNARIDANAVEMGTKSYSEWVKSDEFFDVAHYPEIRFVSESFPLQRLRHGGELSGTLTIRGTDQPATFDLEPSECEHPAYECPIVVTGSIRRSAFGMRSRRGALSDKVDLHFEVFAVPSAERLNP